MSAAALDTSGHSRVLMSWLAGRPAGGFERAGVRNLTALSSDTDAMRALFQPLPSSSGFPVTDYTAMLVSTLYRCLSTIAGAWMQLPVHQYRMLADEGRESMGQTPLWWLLNESPDDAWTAASWREWIVRCTHMRGDQHTEIVRKTGASSGGAVAALRPLHPDNVRPRRDGRRIVYDVFDPLTGKSRGVDQDDMLHFAGFGFDGLKSLSVVQHAARNSLGKLGDSTFVGHTVSGAALFGATDPGSFFDGFEDAQTLDRWRNYTGSGERTVVSVIDAGSGGNILRVGNNSGNDQAWLIHGGNIPFDPTALYRVKARIRRTAGTGTVYVGLAGVAADGTSFVNRSGSNSYSTQHYFAASGAAPASSWTEYTGYVRGTAATGTGGSACTDPSAPGVMHQDVRYIRPLAVVNYNGAAGTTEVDFISVERLGGQIGTGDLGDDAATELLTDQYYFGGTGYGTTTVRTVSFTPAADCRIEIAATIVASGLDGDGGRTVTWYVSVGGGSDTALLGFAAYSTAKQSIAAVTDYAASAGVALDFKLKTHINFAEPSIYLYDSTLRLTAVKK